MLGQLRKMVHIQSFLYGLMRSQNERPRQRLWRAAGHEVELRIFPHVLFMGNYVWTAEPIVRKPLHKNFAIFALFYRRYPPRDPNFDIFLKRVWRRQHNLSDFGVHIQPNKIKLSGNFLGPNLPTTEDYFH